MKKVLTIVVALVLMLTACLTLVACSGVAGEKDLVLVQQNGVLRVGMEAGYKPFNWRQTDDSDGAVAITDVNGYYANGYDVMIAKELAQELNVELSIYAMKFEALITALNAGTIDCIIAGMSPTAERAKSVDFSNAYYESALVVVVREDGDMADKTTLAELKANNANIVAQKGTFHAKALEQLRTVTASQLYDTFPLMITALNAGTIDGYIAEEPGAIADCAVNEGFAYIPLVNNDTGFVASAEDVQIAVGLRKGSTLADRINTTLASLTSADRLAMMEQAIALQSAGE